MSIPVRQEFQVAHARREAQALAEKLGFSRKDVYCIATCASELAGNLVLHAEKGGTVTLVSLEEGERIGLEILVEDTGPGIADSERAMEDGFSTIGGLGGGLPGARRLMDEFELVSAPGSGTRVKARKWHRK